MFHPTSVISSKAQISSNVKIGPFCIVDENVIIEEDPVSYSVQVSDLCGNTSDYASATISASIPPPPIFTFEEVEDGIQFTQLTQDLFTG